MIPARFAPIVFGFCLSGIMSFVVAGISMLRTVGFVEGFVGLWLNAWLSSWFVAFPVVLLVAPFARRIVAKVTAPH